jgi:hypothetical protein
MTLPRAGRPRAEMSKTQHPTSFKVGIDGQEATNVFSEPICKKRMALDNPSFSQNSL